jgi:hypothetical protein
MLVKVEEHGPPLLHRGSAANVSHSDTTLKMEMIYLHKEPAGGLLRPLP